MWSVSNWFRAYGFAEILDELMIGAYPTDSDDIAMLDWLGVKRILNLVEDEEYRPGERADVEAALLETGIEERRIALTDFGGLPPVELEEAVSVVSAWLDQGARTYLHCRAGRQRSAAVAACVVAVRGGIEIDDALEFVTRAKPSADPLEHQRADVQRWWAGRAVR
jgi:atypical dual specificity phosphatase